jgi:hypothetical protein
VNHRSFAGALAALLLTATAALGAPAVTRGAEAASCAPVRSSTVRVITTRNISCGAARQLLRRWVRVGHPRSLGHWYCTLRRRAHRVDGLCSAGNGRGAAYFTFRRYDSG